MMKSKDMSNTKRFIAFDIGIKNLSFIDVSFNQSINQLMINKWKTIDISLTESGHIINTKDFHMLSENLMECLKQEYGNEQVSIDYIIIENQPVLKNPIMKSLQICLYSFFVYKQVVNKEKIGPIKFMNACNKLKPNKWLPKNELDEMGKSIESKNKYSVRKKLSVLMVEKTFELHKIEFEDADKWKTMYLSTKKKDDLADAFNMCLFSISAL